jgi:hypothetical protein
VRYASCDPYNKQQFISLNSSDILHYVTEIQCEILDSLGV